MCNTECLTKFYVVQTVTLSHSKVMTTSTTGIICTLIERKMNFTDSKKITKKKMLYANILTKGVYLRGE